MHEVILSVGIDIGTSTTQLIFSRLTIENRASSYTVPRISIVDKEVVYRSQIYFTPLKSATEIDAEAVKKIVRDEYQMAGMTPADLKTGAVIITGETARKQNANDVLEALSDLAGDFVVATAGPDLESVLSARGAGTDAMSKEERHCQYRYRRRNQQHCPLRKGNAAWNQLPGYRRAADQGPERKDYIYFS